MIGDLAGRKVRVARPKPGHEDALGLEGIARHARYVSQGGLPLDEESEDIESNEVQYYIEARKSDMQSYAASRSFGFSELEPID